jgi:glyoxylase-like metal-dependent hydrolase (beta-lactamase superfamily II)
MSQASPGAPPVMLGMTLPDVDVWSERVAVALGKNPSPFTGPGTNTYLVGTGRRRILLDTGQGVAAWLPCLEQAMQRVGCDVLQEIVLTHAHADHIGGCEQVMRRFGPLEVKKLPWPEVDAGYPFAITPLADGDVVRTEGATLRAIHTPGHAPDHLCYWIEEEDSLVSGDNVLGVGTTVIPAQSGDLAQYLDSLERLLALGPSRIYPAHGPCIEDGRRKIREYLDHRHARDAQILSALRTGARDVPAIVAIVYAAYPAALHAAAGQSVTSHLLKLEREGRVQREAEADSNPVLARWLPAD